MGKWLMLLALFSPAGATILELSEDTVRIDFDLAEGDQQVRLFQGVARGDTVKLQLVYADTFDINGWGATLQFDGNQLGYVSGSFQASELIPELSVLIDETRLGKVGVGGRVLGFDTQNMAPSGALGTLTIVVKPGFRGSADLVIADVQLSVVGGEFDYANTYSARRGIVAATIEGTVPLLPGDFDGNGAVDFDDFFMFVDYFGGSDARFDLDGNGAIDFDDFFAFVDNFGTGT